MFTVGAGAGAGWAFALGTALLGAALSPAAEALIARLLPRLGGTPVPSARITTAALTGVACGAFALRFGVSWTLPAFLFLAILGVQLARIDFSLHLLPNPLVLALLAGGIALLLAPSTVNQHADNMLRALLGMVILFAGYLILGLISPGAIGMGDVKLAAPVGLYLGYLGWTHLLYGGLLGFILNGVVTIAVVAQKSRKDATEVAHGPSMLGSVLAISLLIP
ncbi:peptidase A24A prepilin type IV [Pseudarthrobacter chlorophenolicus A6]|uniref:Peptidase A24A prepilin type IV n=1 Tax=Pseudarthrobacter chlorophenolicus (strain ATCC 700700 / DSM 12829 / CIP 107037 / JCM 12360 / KCTC 9906 / NCIMB 13794 / A6) TaxID=452863 RepID=B8HCI1_PSECP|nr:prepilin peptidase [Pseudarthrobacter chlorophenolicus]ACL40597.1 peptidase A24A prepilin type IV [Pseudarthrobacter chlorophenolicus A6]